MQPIITQSLDNNYLLPSILANNKWIDDVLNDWEMPIEERLSLLKNQRRALIQAGYPTRDTTNAIHKLSTIALPQRLILVQRPFQLFVTINCTTAYPNHIATKHLQYTLTRVNDRLYNKRWQKQNTGMEAFGVLERHSKLLGDKTSGETGVIDVLPHWHLVIKPASGYEVLDAAQVEQAFQFVLKSPSNQIESRRKDESGMLLRNVCGAVLKDPVFDPHDIDVKELLTNLDDENISRYMTKNLFRGGAPDENHRTGLHHFNRNGLIKIF